MKDDNLQMSPVIGIGADIQPVHDRDSALSYLSYVEAVREAGGVVVLIPPQPDHMDQLLDSLDGVVLAGGDDCDPSLYGEERHPTCEPMDARRQSNDLALARTARKRQVPTLGICLGMQVMAVASGGALVQDIGSELLSELEHASSPSDRLRHHASIEQGTRLAAILGETEVTVNSSHHQAVKRVGDGIRITALAPDGVIEGLEDPSHPFYVGVQWHPEDMRGEELSTRLFAAFIEAARERHRVRTDRT